MWFRLLLTVVVKLLLVFGPIAQRLEQQTHNLLVVGSNPAGATNKLNIEISMITNKFNINDTVCFTIHKKQITGKIIRIYIIKTLDNEEIRYDCETESNIIIQNIKEDTIIQNTKEETLIEFDDLLI